MAWRFSIRSWNASTATTSTRAKRIAIREATGRPGGSFHSASSALRLILDQPLAASMGCSPRWSRSPSPLPDFGRRRSQRRGLQHMLAYRRSRRYYPPLIRTRDTFNSRTSPGCSRIPEASSLLDIERRTGFVETGGEFGVMRPPGFVIDLHGRQPFVYERASGESIFASNLLEEVVYAVPIGFAPARERQQKIVIRFQFAIQ